MKVLRQLTITTLAFMTLPQIMKATGLNEEQLKQL